jgi:hypothetical protein
VTWFLGFLAAQRSGIVVILLVVTVGCALLQWVLWMFGWGRFRGSVTKDSTTRYVLQQFFVKIIYDFRNLLALIVVALFAGALFTAMWTGIQEHSVDQLKEGLQSVAAALGGLIGSIIGYYFGESAGKGKLPGAKDTAAQGGQAEQDPPSGESTDEGITRTKKPDVV